MNTRIHILTNNHFDLTWRRCWDRRLTWKGDTYASYSEIEQGYFEDHLALAAAHPEYRFEAESTAVLRQFLRRCPERRAELAALVAARRFSVSGAGDNIVDGVMVLGESLVRNFTTGLAWLEHEIGIRPLLAVRNDAFGNPAQLPQILRGCGLDWVQGLSYSPCHGRYWRGLDGSVVCTAAAPDVAHGGGWQKYPPCPQCRGAGCAACRGRGIDHARGVSRLPDPPDEGTLRRGGVGVVRMTPEEALPDPAIIAWARELAQRCEVRFSLAEDLRPELAAWLEQVDTPPPGEVHDGVELGFNNSGCWVTRIGLKQELRRREYALRAAETWAALAAGTGASFPREDHAACWEALLFTMFHDAVTATHVDAAYEELREINAALAARTDRLAAGALAPFTAAAVDTISVPNPLGRSATALVEVEAGPDGVAAVDASGRPLPVIPDGSGRARVLATEVPPLGAAAFALRRGGRSPRALENPVIESHRFRVRADEHGPVEIEDKALGRALCRQAELRPGELLLEQDVGSPWATLEEPRARLPLSDYTKLVAAEAGDGWQRLRLRTGGFGRFFSAQGGMRSVEAETEVLLVDGLERIEFRTVVDWDTYNLRLRVAFPAAWGGTAWYGVPYGALPRPAYVPEWGWSGANGDHPAVEWAGIQGSGASLAVFDRGTPSYRVAGRTLFLSLLRSPAIPTFLHEPRSYSMTDFDGMRDAGRHVFHYALTAYDRPFLDSPVIHDAEAFNAGLAAVAGRVTLPAAPRLEGQGVRLGAVKWADEGDGLVLRLAECAGRTSPVVVHLPPPWSRVDRTDLRERQAEPLAVESGRVSLTLQPWQLATLRVH